MKFRSFIILTVVVLAGISQTVFAQVPQPPPPVPAASPTPKLSDVLIASLASAPTEELPRERREQAYAKLLEGQRYLITSARPRTPAGVANALRMARQALQRSVELDPRLAEGYTALAELMIATQPQDLDEAISLAAIATRIQPDNFGGHRIMARLYTFKSRLNTGTLDKNFADKAVASWKEIARLDPRNAEAWAFLSEFYDKANASDQRINALKKWLASAPPVETKFWERMSRGDRDSLQPEQASLKLGPALMKAGKTQEALSVLSNVVADDPENIEAVELLRDAIESVNGAGAATAIESLQQAAYANPENIALVNLLAQVNARAGKMDDAARVLQEATRRFAEKDKATASFFQVSLGDLYISANRVNEGVAAYQNALAVRGIALLGLATDDDREFAANVFTKMIRVYKDANRPLDVKAVIDRARQVFGKDDLFADMELISFYRENGKKVEALQAVRAVRVRIPNDYSYLRMEATLLAETGKVDLGVALIRNLIDNKPVKGVAGTEPSIESMSPMYDDFSNYVFISGLYSNAHRGKEAIAAANSAYTAAATPARKEMAKTTLAIAQEMAGDFAGAEATLREILKKTPDNSVALNNLGYFLLERNQKLEEALEMIKKALVLDPDNASFLDSLGWAHYKLGNYAEAEKKLLEAIRINNMSSTIQEHLGDVYLKQGKAPQAKAAWEKALLLTSDAAEITRIKGKLGRK